MSLPRLVVIACLVAPSLAACFLAPPAHGQDAALDVLDGETLYDGGWLLSLGIERERSARRLDGSHSVDDPLRRVRRTNDLAFGVHHGVRHDVQLSLLVPRVDRTLRLRPPGAPSVRLAASGLGDVTALAKWRFFRWDAPHRALNVALLAGVELPTGDDDVHDGGLRLPADLQPGRGSYNPLLGLAATYEPARWRFNAVALFVHGGGGGEDETGDSFLAELSVGNRFWLEPYPGPFMRADLALRHRRDERVHVADDFLLGPPLANDPVLRPSGGDVTSVALNWAFRPRPSVDVQLELEHPIAQRVHGDDFEDDTTLSLRVGYRF